MRCPSCEKFVSYDTEVDVETDELEVEGARLTGSVRRVLTCADCGDELKEATLEFDTELEFTVEGGENGCAYPLHQWGDAEITASPTTEMQTKDRNGKTITNYRYMKTLYGAEVVAEQKCETCDATRTASASESCPASGFDELV